MMAKTTNTIIWMVSALVSVILFTELVFSKILYINGNVYSLDSWVSIRPADLSLAILKFTLGWLIAAILARTQKNNLKSIVTLDGPVNIKLSLFAGLVFGLALGIGLFMASDIVSMFSSYMVNGF